jgi:uncharacterized radical SAM protein YgiQ
MYLPTTNNEIEQLGWKQPDIILVSGDSYIDSPYIGVAVIGKVLSKAGYKVGIICQPDVKSEKDIIRLGEPALFWAVTAGSIDSMVANYTASGKKRRTDDYTPGGINNRRPDRASIVYTNLIKQYFKSRKPIVLGGIEASLRRIAHYDYWSDKVRGSILFDTKADFLLYGMAERSVIELAQCIKENGDARNVRGLCYISSEPPSQSTVLPDFEIAAKNKEKFAEMFHVFYQNNDPVTAKTLIQKHGTRYLVQNPPAFHLNTSELDEVYKIKYMRGVHPYYENLGKVKALDTIRFSILTHRGCYGECNFCAISVHQGRKVRWRSMQSIVDEARELTSHSDFKGTIHDLGGPTANMYGIECKRKDREGCCTDKRCLYPDICDELPVNHSRQTTLLKTINQIDGIKKVNVASGIRYDMIVDDQKSGPAYLDNLVSNHVSGQLKIAPEHSETHILGLMGKPSNNNLTSFKKKFYQATKKAEKKQFLTYYMIAAHPGCSDKDMKDLRNFALSELGILPEQVQIFTPTPSTYSTLMYWTGRDPFTNRPVYVERGLKGKMRQKNYLSMKRDGRH